MASWCGCAPAAAVPSFVPVAPKVATVSAFKSPRAVAGEGFGPGQRLRQPGEFAAVLASTTRLRGELFEIRFRENDLGMARLGLVMPKRLAKRAVLRNSLKRLARESFRVRTARLPALDLVVRLVKPSPARPADPAARARWRNELGRLLDRLAA